LFTRDHAHCYAAKEAVAEELSLSEELFTAVVLEQDNYTAATSCFCVYSSCQNFRAKVAKATNSIANGTNSFANGTTHGTIFRDAQG